jgi:hypothetical protein
MSSYVCIEHFVNVFVYIQHCVYLYVATREHLADKQHELSTDAIFLFYIHAYIHTYMLRHSKNTRIGS